MTLSVAMRHRFNPATVIDLAFAAPTPGVTALFGPSGAGKSTVVAAVAGLLRPDWAHVELDGDVLADTARHLWSKAETRRVGVVFQESRLFPHLSVEANLRFGLRRAKSPRLAFDDVVGLLGVGALLRRRPHTLSGGERQRVAIGRALLASPRLLLMDEPLASLDAARRAEILPYLAGLRALDLPILYVTHAIDEVGRLADTLVLMEQGEVVAAGALDAIAARADLPLGRRDDAASLHLCRIAAHDRERELTALAGSGAEFLVPLQERPIGAEMRTRIPAREVALAVRVPEGISFQNVIPARVRALAPEPERRSVMVELALPQGGLLSRVTHDAVARLGLARGTGVLALVKSTAIEIL